MLAIWIRIPSVQAVKRIVKYLEHTGNKNIRIKIIQPEIEDVFMKLMQYQEVSESEI